MEKCQESNNRWLSGEKFQSFYVLLEGEGEHLLFSILNAAASVAFGGLGPSAQQVSGNIEFLFL
jgi:hypothetical protein